MTKPTSTFPKTFLKADFTMAATVTLNSTDFVPVLKYRVPVRQRVANGNGRINLGVDDRGTAKMDLFTSAPLTIPGVWRITVADANQVNQTFIREVISSDMIAGIKMGVGGKTGNDKGFVVAGEYAYIILEFKSTAASAIATLADSTIQYPVQVQTLS